MNNNFLIESDIDNLIFKSVKSNIETFSKLIEYGYIPIGIGFEKALENYFPYSYFNIKENKHFTCNSNPEENYNILYFNNNTFFEKNQNFKETEFQIISRAKRLDSFEYIEGIYNYKIDNYNRKVHYIDKENQEKYYSNFSSYEIDPTTLEHFINEKWLKFNYLH